MSTTKNKRGRPVQAKPSKTKLKNRKIGVESMLQMIAHRHKVKRPENFLSDRFDVDVYAIRQWLVRGVPKAIQSEFSELAGVSVEVVAAL